nr:DUF92 domain-containing protein [Bacillus suaedaesalsae]
MLFILFVIAVAKVGYMLKALSLSGAIAASFVGSCIVIGLNGEGLVLLGLFFGTSSLLSKNKSRLKTSTLQIVEKGDTRDFGQVLANGLIPALSCLLFAYTDNDLWIYTYAVSLAAANADTWASEIGTLSKRKPVHILTFKRVAHGTSGAVSLLGLIATLVGAFIIGAGSYLLFDSVTITHCLYIVLFGAFGSIVDTILGATIQAKFQCEHCEILTEKRVHCCDRTNLKSGIAWMNNDAINFSSIIITVILAVIFV